MVGRGSVDRKGEGMERVLFNYFDSRVKEVALMKCNPYASAVASFDVRNSKM